MAHYKHGSFFEHSQAPVFDMVFSPGTAAPLSGIYRCTACGYEDACNEGLPLPPQSHAVHPHYLTPIKWRLVTAAHHKS